jgi:hypothetical protein
LEPNRHQTSRRASSILHRRIRKFEYSGSCNDRIIIIAPNFESRWVFQTNLDRIRFLKDCPSWHKIRIDHQAIVTKFQTVQWLFLLIIMKVAARDTNRATIGTIKSQLKESVHTTYDDKGKRIDRGRVCCCCDILLNSASLSKISLKALRRKRWAKAPKNIEQNILQHYTYNAQHINVSNKIKENIQKLFISPRTNAYVERNTNRPVTEDNIYFDLCHSCEEAEGIPKLCLHSLPIGEPPKVITDLSNVELALICQGRASTHTFQIFAGCHTSMRTWHQIYFQDVAHIEASMLRMDEMHIPDNIYCALCGPFTKQQHKDAMKMVKIDRRKILLALLWLKEHNIHYKSLVIPDMSLIPEPIIVDHSDHEDSADTNLESQHVTTVYFPQIGELAENKGDNNTKESFLKEVLDSSKNGRYDVQFRTSKTSLKEWESHALLSCFPLQFPYGNGAKPVKVSPLKYYQYMMRLSSPQFQKADFILFLTNLHFKNEVVKTASIKCKYRLSDQCLAIYKICTIFSSVEYSLLSNSVHSEIQTKICACNVFQPCSSTATNQPLSLPRGPGLSYEHSDSSSQHNICFITKSNII